MDHSHSPALDRLIRRQRVSDPSLPVSDSSSPAAVGGADSTSSSSPISVTTTSAAPVVSTTTTSSAVQVTTTSSASSVVESSTSSTTAVTTTPVQETSQTVASTSSTTTTTTPVAVTSSSTTSTSSTTVRPVTSAEEAQTATSTSARTTVVIVSGSASSTSASSASLASSTAGSSSDSSIGTGGVIGIVAGAVVGVVFVAALIAFLFKKYSRKDDDDQISPFDKDEFRRASVMLDDDDQHYAHSLNSYRGGGGGGLHQGQGHSPQMSEYSMSNVGVGAILPGLARGNTLQSPRPPTQIMNHYQHQQMMPSFQPGQVVPNSPNNNSNGNPYAQQFPNNGSPPLGQYAPMDPYANQYNGMLPQHPQPVHQQYDQSGLSAGQWNGGGMVAGQNLSRANSQVSSYSQFSDSGSNPNQQQHSRSILPPALRSGQQQQQQQQTSSHGHPDERPLSLVNEDDESYGQHEIEYVQERSGTPTNSNVQQTFFGREGVSAERGEWNEGEEERRRRLSIRNGGLDQDRDDPYDGMH